MCSLDYSTTDDPWPQLFLLNITVLLRRLTITFFYCFLATDSLSVGSLCSVQDINKREQKLRGFHIPSLPVHLSVRPHPNHPAMTSQKPVQSLGRRNESVLTVHDMKHDCFNKLSTQYYKLLLLLWLHWSKAAALSSLWSLSRQMKFKYKCNI